MGYRLLPNRRHPPEADNTGHVAVLGGTNHWTPHETGMMESKAPCAKEYSLSLVILVDPAKWLQTFSGRWPCNIDSSDGWRELYIISNQFSEPTNGGIARGGANSVKSHDE